VLLVVSCAAQWRNWGGQRGQLPPDAADEGAQNSLTENILTTIKVSLMKFAE